MKEKESLKIAISVFCCVIILMSVLGVFIASMRYYSVKSECNRYSQEYNMPTEFVGWHIPETMTERLVDCYINTSSGKRVSYKDFKFSNLD